MRHVVTMTTTKLGTRVWCRDPDGLRYWGFPGDPATVRFRMKEAAAACARRVYGTARPESELRGARA